MLMNMIKKQAMIIFSSFFINQNMKSTKNTLGIQIGKKIQNLRKQKGFSQEKFAEAINIATTSLSYIETGRGFMTLATMQKICEVLKIEPAEIFQFISIQTKEEMYNYISEKLENIKENPQQLELAYNLFKNVI